MCVLGVAGIYVVGSVGVWDKEFASTSVSVSVNVRVCVRERKGVCERALVPASASVHDLCMCLF